MLAGKELLVGRAVLPGDEGGLLSSGISRPGRLSVGDLDLWNFTVAAGKNVRVEMDAASTSPHVRVFGPEGSLALSAFTPAPAGGILDASFTAATTGTYLIVVGSYVLGGEGDYSLRVTTGGLSLRRPVVSGGSLRIDALGGDPSARVVLLSSTSLSAPRSAWTSIATNQLDASGAFSFTVPFQRSERSRYYQLVEP